MRIFRLNAALVFSLILSTSSEAQVISGKARNPNEVSIAVNHQDESRMLASCNIDWVFHSSDSGKTWKTAKQKSSYGVYGDPVLYCNSKGTFFHSHLSKSKGKEWPEWFDCIVVQTSKDGKKWNNGVAVGKNEGRMQDKEWMSGDENPNSAFYGNLYLSWTEFDSYKNDLPDCHSRIMFSFSSDEGESFSEPLVVSDTEGDCKDDDGTMEGATTAVGPNGEVYIVWAGNGYLWMDVSYDGGKTFGTDRKIMELVMGWNLDVPGIYRSNGMPFIQCDPNSGRLYVVYGDQKNQYNQVFLLYSDDAGASWHRVELGLDRGHAFFPNIAFNPRNGKLGLIYYQMTPAKDSLQTILLSIDRNHEITRHLLSDPFRVPGKYFFFGDYIDIDYLGNGFIGAWTGYENKKLVIRVGRAD